MWKEREGCGGYRGRGAGRHKDGKDGRKRTRKGRSYWKRGMEPGRKGKGGKEVQVVEGKGKKLGGNEGRKEEELFQEVGDETRRK